MCDFMLRVLEPLVSVGAGLKSRQDFQVAIGHREVFALGGKFGAHG